MTIDTIIELAARAQAEEIIARIDSGELTYEQAIAGLQGNKNEN